MRWLRTLSLAFALALAGLTPSHAAFDDGDLICETTSTTGTGTVNLAGACTNYVTFLSQITSGSETTYTIVSGDGKIETGTGTFTDGAPDTLTRTALWSTDGSGAELSLTGVSTVYLQWNTASYKGGINSFTLLDLTAATGTFSTSVNVTSTAQTVAGSGGHLTVEGATIWDSGNDGAGSTLDADLLDGNSSAAFQPIDADLTSWALITRAAGFDTFTTTPSSANLRSLLTDEIGTGVLVFSGTPADDQVSVGDSASAVTWRTIADSDTATQKLQYDQATNTFSAGTDDDVPDSGDFTNLTGGTGITNTTGTLSVDFSELTFGSGLTSTGASTLDCDAATTSVAGCSTLTTTTEALTGTDTAKNITADAMAALWEKGSNVASAGTVSLGEGWLFHITGTTTITDIDFATAKDGRQAVLIFDGALTLTHNATTLDIPGGANISTAAGDVAFITQDSSDNIKVTGYVRDATTPPSGVNTGDQTITLTGDVTGSGTGSFAATIATDSVALTTDTTGNYVGSVADGTGVDGTAAGEGATYTPTLDFTEITPSVTWGAGSFTTMIWDAGATDPTATFASNSVTWSNAATYSLGTSAALTTGTVELGAASDTTIARTGAGAISVEGSAVQLASTTDVVQVADGTGVDGTCSTAACTYTPTLDFTEVTPSATFGAGSFTTLAFDAGATDPTFTFASNSTTVSNSAVFSLGTSAAFTTGTIELGAASDTTLARTGAGAISVEGSAVQLASTVDVVQVADGTGIDGTCSTAGCTYTPTFDATEITTATWGANNFTSQVVSTDGVDLTWDFTTTDAIATLSGGGTSPGIALDDQGALRFLEEDAGGSNYLEFKAPAAVTTTQTCTLEDDSSMIPDSCVGDGTDASGTPVEGTAIDVSGSTVSWDATEVNSVTWGSAGAFTTMAWDAGATDPTATFASNSITWSNAATFSLGTSAALTTGTIEVGAASDTTVARGSAGHLSVEGATVWDSGNDGSGSTLDADLLDGNSSAAFALAATDFTAGVGLSGGGTLAANRTFTFDGTEVTSNTWGANNFTTMVFSTDGVDLTWDYSTVDGAGILSGGGTSPILGIDDGGRLRLYEEDAGGSNVIDFIAPTTLASDRTCQLVDGAAMIPDSCVGDGTDAGGGGAQISGTPADNQVAVWTNSTTIEGDSAFTFDTATDAMSISTAGVFTTGTIELGAASDTTISRTAAGEAALEGDVIKHAGKETIYIPSPSMVPNVTSGPATGTYDSGSNDLTVYTLDFDTGATEERADFQIAMPKAWNEGTFSFIPTSVCTGCSAAQTIQFELACVAISHDDTMNATMGTAASSSVTVTATNDNQTGAESSAITCAGTPAEGDLVAFRISRDTSVDNGAGDARLIGIKLFWTSNAGSDD